MPWYLLSHRIFCEGEHPIIQSVAVAWESTLCTWIEIVGNEAVTAIHFVGSGDTPGDWTMKRIDEVWYPSADEADVTGPLIFRMHGETGLWCSNDEPVPDENPLRRSLFRMPSAHKKNQSERGRRD